MKPISILKIALALMSIICVFDMPYGYYQLYRVIALGGFIYLAYNDQESKEWGDYLDNISTVSSTFF